jgi:hypothetical protein
MDKKSSRTNGPSGGRRVIVSVRMSAEERRLLLEDAGHIGCSASDLLRRLAGQAAGLGPVLTASDRHVLLDVLASLRSFAQQVEALERTVRHERSAVPDDVTRVLTDAAGAAQALAGLYVAMVRDGRERLMGAAA